MLSESQDSQTSAQAKRWLVPVEPRQRELKFTAGTDNCKPQVGAGSPQESRAQRTGSSQQQWLCLLWTMPSTTMHTDAATQTATTMYTDATTQTEPLESGPSNALRDRPRPLRMNVAQGSRVTRAYGFKLDRECLNRWTRTYYEEVWPGKLDKMSAKQVREALRDLRPATIVALPRDVYRVIPTIPRFERSIVSLDPVAGSFVFVFKDNSSHAALHAPVSLEDIERAKEMLGVDESEPVRWYRVRD